VHTKSAAPAQPEEVDTLSTKDWVESATGKGSATHGPGHTVKWRTWPEKQWHSAGWPITILIRLTKSDCSDYPAEAPLIYHQCTHQVPRLAEDTVGTLLASHTTTHVIRRQIHLYLFTTHIYIQHVRVPRPLATSPHVCLSARLLADWLHALVTTSLAGKARESWKGMWCYFRPLAHAVLCCYSLFACPA